MELIIMDKMQELFDVIGGEAQNRTVDTGIFSPLLYRLSYLATLKESIKISYMG